MYLDTHEYKYQFQRININLYTRKKEIAYNTNLPT